MSRRDAGCAIELVKGAAKRLADLGSDQAAEASEWLIAWCDRAKEPPLVGFAGEFSSGKSTLINALLGAKVCETSANPCTREPLELAHGTAESGDDRVTPGRTLVDCALLQTFRLLDTPGFDEPGADPQLTRSALSRCDAVVWCTLALKAWSRTDEEEFDRLPDPLRRAAVLAVTRVDNLNSDLEADKIIHVLRDRAVRERFSHVVKTAAPKSGPPQGIAALRDAMVDVLGRADVSNRHHRELCQELRRQAARTPTPPDRDSVSERKKPPILQELHVLVEAFSEEAQQVDKQLENFGVGNFAAYRTPYERGGAAVKAYESGHEQRNHLRARLGKLIPSVEGILAASESGALAGNAIDESATLVARLQRAANPEIRLLRSQRLHHHAHLSISTHALANTVRLCAGAHETAQLLRDVWREVSKRYEVGAAAKGTPAALAHNHVSVILSDLLDAVSSECER